MKMKFAVDGIHCSACAAAIERKVRPLPGVRKCYVNVVSKELTVESSGNTPSEEAVIRAVSEAGFTAVLLKKDTPRAGDKEGGFLFFLRLLTAIVFSLILMYASMHSMFHLPWYNISPGWSALIQILLLLPVLGAGYTFYTRGFPALLRFSPNMDSLIACGTASSILYSLILIFRGTPEHLYFDSAAMIISLVMLGKFLEARSKGRATEAVRSLMTLIPPSAVVLRNGKEITVDADSLAAGDEVRIRSGWKIPADGVVLEGSANIDESMLTGESMPVVKCPGDTVTGGTVAGGGTFLFRVTRTGEDTTLARIIAMVQGAQESRPPIARMADTVSGYFVWFVLCCSVLTFCLWFFCSDRGFGLALEFAIAVMVIACPCAMGLAVPVALITGIGRGAKLGILIKNGEALEKAGKLKTVVFDKTGTLTEGRPDLVDVLSNGTVTREVLIRMAASAEKGSSHPLSGAFLRAAEKNNVIPENVASFTEVPGKGILCMFQKKQLLLGNQAWMAENKVTLPDLKTGPGTTPVYMAEDGLYVCCFTFEDILRPGAARCVDLLHEMNLKVRILSGDTEEAAKTLSEQLKLDSFQAKVLPEEKASAIGKIRSHDGMTAMVGDGINDSPALAAADIGIAMRSGTDAAMETADIVLMRSDLRNVPDSIRLSKAVIRIMKENLFWAFAYNGIMIPLAAGAFFPLWGWHLNPAVAALAMTLSSLTVVGNSLRLRKFL